MKTLRYMLLPVLLLMLCPRAALALCSLSGNKETVTMTVSSTIVLDPNAAVGTVLATSPVASPSPSTSQVTCILGNTNIGVINLAGAQPNGSSTIFPTGVAGVGYRILHPDSSYILPPWGYDSIESGTYTLSVGSALQLVKTGPIADGATLGGGTLGYWRYAGLLGNVRAEDFVLANAVTFVSPSCKVTTPDIAVTLPTVSTTALAGTGATAGATAFTIRLDCASNAAGRTLAIQFDTSTPYAGANGVIVPTVPTAGTRGAGVVPPTGNVGVQLVNANANFSPVTFGTAAVVGTTPEGAYSLTYYARYYAMATPVTPGKLTATATFTISYP